MSLESPEPSLEQPLTGHRAGFYCILAEPHSWSLDGAVLARSTWRTEGTTEGGRSWRELAPSPAGVGTGLFYDVQTIMSALSSVAPGGILVMSLAALES